MPELADRLPAQDVLPFPPAPSASIAGRTMQESVYDRRTTPRQLPADAPNILIVLIDDAGPGLPDTLGGEVRTDTSTRIHSATRDKSSALSAEVLKSYGYATAAFGKWHNTPAEETTAAGPFENWPAGLGFEYFYGFLAGGGVAVRTEPGAQHHGGPAARDDRGP